MCTRVFCVGAWMAQHIAVAGEPLMEIDASMTRDILGLALLAVLSKRPSSRSEAVDAVRGLCLPWLTPTREVVGGLVSEYFEAGLLYAAREHGRDVRPLDGALLEMTPDGERELRRLVLYRTGQPAHPLVVLCESLRLSVADRLDPPVRDKVFRGQIRARRRCLATQQRRLAGAGPENPVLAHTLRHQLACAQAEFDALVRASRADSGEGSALVHSHCHRIARAQAELDALGGEPREGGRDAEPLVAFPT